MKKFFRLRVLFALVLILPFFSFAVFKLFGGFGKTNENYFNFSPSNVTMAVTEPEQVTESSTLESALSKLSSSSEEEPVTINFSLNITAEDAKKTIELQEGYATFTGTISSASAEPIFKIAPTAQNNHFVFDLKLKSTAEDKEYAILFDGESASQPAYVELGSNIKTDYKYLCNYVAGCTNLSFAEGASLVTEQPLKIVYPYDIGSRVVLSNYTGDMKDKVQIVSANESLYGIETYASDNTLSADANINIKFSNNTGTENVKSQTFKFDRNFDFPTAVDDEYAHHQFAGWFAKALIAGKTYYIENTEASVSALEGEETSTLLSSLEEANKDNCFVGYGTSADDLCHRVIQYFLNHSTVPEFELLWEDVQYTVTFDAGEGQFAGGLHASTSSGIFGASITLPDQPTRYGYNFAGWKLDEDEQDFEQKTFDKDYRVHAAWVARQYSIDFYINAGDERPLSTATFTFGQPIDYPTNPQKEGYTFDGHWYTEDDILFDDASMLDNFDEVGGVTKISLHAKWTLNRYTVYLLYNNVLISSLEFDYNTQITMDMLPKPTPATGYVFDTYYLNDQPFAPFALKSDVELYARFALRYFDVHFCLGYDNDRQIVNKVGYNRPIFFPETSRANYILVGWFADENFSKAFENGTAMGTTDIYLYAKWQAKKQVEIDQTIQTYNAGSAGFAFVGFSNLNGFTVEYLVDGVWESWAPARVGAFDVKISRAEDATYASFQVVLEKALVVEPQYINVTWIIALLMIAFLAEVLTCVLLKIMKKLKSNLSLSVAFVPLLSMFLNTSTGDLFVNDTQAISSTQFILLLVSAALVLIGFVVMIVFIYKLHRTAAALVVENVPDEQRLQGTFDGTARLAPKDTADDEKIKSKIDDYLNGFVTNKHGYVKQDGEAEPAELEEEETAEPEEAGQEDIPVEAQSPAGEEPDVPENPE